VSPAEGRSNCSTGPTYEKIRYRQTVRTGGGFSHELTELGEGDLELGEIKEKRLVYTLRKQQIISKGEFFAKGSEK